MSLWVDDIQKASGASNANAITFTTDMQAIGAERRWISDAFDQPDKRYLDCDVIWGGIARGTVSDTDIFPMATSSYQIFDTCFNPAIYGGLVAAAAGIKASPLTLMGVGI